MLVERLAGLSQNRIGVPFRIVDDYIDPLFCTTVKDGSIAPEDLATKSCE